MSRISRKTFLTRWIGLTLLFLLVGGEGFLHPFFHCSGKAGSRLETEARSAGAVLDGCCGRADTGLNPAPCPVCAGVLHIALIPELPASVAAPPPEPGCDVPAAVMPGGGIRLARARAPPVA